MAATTKARSTRPPFDVAPLWNCLITVLKFVKGRLQSGQTDIEGAKMNDHIFQCYTNMRKVVIPSAAEAGDGRRQLFWDDCKKRFAPIFDCAEKKVIGSPRFHDFYSVLYGLQKLIFEMPPEHWASQGKPKVLPFAEEAPKSRQRSRSPLRTFIDGPIRKPVQMGVKDIWRWKNPPLLLHEGKGYWLFGKAPFWVCETPENVTDLMDFQIRPEGERRGRLDGHFTLWINQKYAKLYDFLTVYDREQGFEYGLLNRLDRETSGPVVVVKDVQTFWTLKYLRDQHLWHKEYMCLVHGQIPPDASDGVIDNFLRRDDWTRTTVAEEERKEGGKPATSIYKVVKYYRQAMPEGGERKFTLVHVRIMTGRQHQVRVHMQYLLQKLGDRIGENEDCGLVGDFLYLQKETLDADRKICDRVFLHERLLGMWDIDGDHRTVCVTQPLPQDLQETLSKLSEDTRAGARLAEYRAKLAANDPLEAFCQKYQLNAKEKQVLRSETNFWGHNPLLKEALMRSFEALAGDGLPTLSMAGDHSFLFMEIRQSVEQRMRGSKSGQDGKGVRLYALEEALRWFIDEKLLRQLEELEAASAANVTDDLPPGWRRITENATKQSFYIHETCGTKVLAKPLVDDDLPDGWAKFEDPASPGGVRYFHARAGRWQPERPSTAYALPAGWKKCTSASNSGQVYYRHERSGVSQLGLPCEGEVETDLPEDWEKRACPDGGEPFYFHRGSKKTQSNKPMKLPEGWKEVASSSGQKYFFHTRSGHSQFMDPRELPEGWYAKESSSKAGQVYFWHEATNRSQYEKPLGQPTPQTPSGIKAG
eukprot:TRINITY_DN22334_c1_g1_i1.p1 TRINITY_DN22334_c1_g1~~TRINITY_DN22334_c1_g1_i1.p1  ORF type:complete len:815 (+),score=137.86 TRINITY_DN22334_c1_g1_i1:228-2672(+)